MSESVLPSLAIAIALAVLVYLVLLIVKSLFWPKLVDIPFEFVPLFSSLDKAQIQSLKKLIDGLQVPKNIYIIRQNGTDDSLYYLLNGKVNILKSGSVYNNLLKEVREGEFFGELAFLFGNDRIASAVAVEKTLLIRIQRKNYAAVLKIIPEINEMILACADQTLIRHNLSNYEELRSLSMENRQKWIDDRAVKENVEASFQIDSDFGWLALTAGRLDINDQRHTAPCLIRVSKGLTVHPKGTTRICLLHNLHPIPKS